MHEKSLLDKLQRVLPQLVAVLAGTIGAISDGMHYGWTAPMLPVLESNNTHINLSNTDHLWLESVYIIGGIIGLPVAIFAVDILGRKGSIVTSAFVGLASWILIAVADNCIYLYIARFIVGLSGDVAFVAAPMYISEIADKSIRGFLSGFIYVMLLTGILVIYTVTPYVSFYVPSIIGSVLVIIQLITFPFMPDSPYYLIFKNKENEARIHLQKLRRTNDVNEELEEISAAVYRQKSESGRPQDLFLKASNRKAVVIMVILNAAQHLSGISVMLMNLHEILDSANSRYMSAEISSILFAALMLLAAIIADVLIDQFGRKSLLVISSFLTSVSLLALAIYFTLKNNGYDVLIVSWIPAVSVMVYAAVFKFGLGIIPIVMTAELFPTTLKAMGMTIADCAYLSFAWLSIDLYQRLSLAYGHEVPFYLFSFSSMLTAIFAQIYIPETKGKTLEEIQFILKGVPFPMRSNSLRSQTFSFRGTLGDNDNKAEDVSKSRHDIKNTNL